MLADKLVARRRRDLLQGNGTRKSKRDQIALLRNSRCTHPKVRMGTTQLHHEADNDGLLHALASQEVLVITTKVI
jgi:hypothetical protein